MLTGHRESLSSETLQEKALHAIYRDAGQDSSLLFSDYVVQCLAELGCDMAFGIPGGAVSSLYYSLTRSEHIRFILTQHECAAAMMALGYSVFQSEKKIPICLTTSGPGATNSLTGVCSAFEERVPLLVLSGNVSTSLKGKWAAQDSYEGAVDLVGMFQSVTASSQGVRSHAEFTSQLFQAYEAAIQESIPVHLNIPIDLASAKLANLPAFSNPLNGARLDVANG